MSNDFNPTLATPIPLVIGEKVLKLHRFCPAIEEAHADWLQVNALKALQKLRKAGLSDADFGIGLVKITENYSAGEYLFTSDAFQKSLGSVPGTKHVFFQCLKAIPEQKDVKEEHAYALWDSYPHECGAALSQIWGKSETPPQKQGAEARSEVTPMDSCTSFVSSLTSLSPLL